MKFGSLRGGANRPSGGVASGSKSTGGSLRGKGGAKPTPTVTAGTYATYTNPNINTAAQKLPEEHDGITYDPAMTPLDVSDCSVAYSGNQALWTAYASALVYSHPDVIRHIVLDVWGWADFEYFLDEKVGVSGFGMFNDTACIVATAGDFSPSAQSCWQTKPSCNKDKPFNGFKDALVHHGFNLDTLALASTIRAFILRARENNPSLPVFLAGHSIGGAIATLVLAYCTFDTNMKAQLEYFKRTHGEEVVNDPPLGANAAIPITAVYTFGSPRVGSPGFRQALKNTIPATGIYRLTNLNDMLPEMPSLDWQHVGTRVFISDEGLAVGKQASKGPMERFRAESRNGAYCSPDMKFHQIRFYLFTLAEYWKAYLAEQQMKRSLQSSFYAFPEPTTAPKPRLAESVHKKLPATPQKGGGTRPIQTTTTTSMTSANPQIPAYQNLELLSHLELAEEPQEPEQPQEEASQPQLRPQPQPKVLSQTHNPVRRAHTLREETKTESPPSQVSLHKSMPVIRVGDQEGYQIPQQLLSPQPEAPQKQPQQPQQPQQKLQPSKPQPLSKSQSATTLNNQPKEKKEKKEKKGKKGKDLPPAAKDPRLGVFVLDGKQKKIYPIFKRLIILDEKLKTQNSIAEREPNDYVSYVLLYRKPALAHGGPIKFKVIVDGQHLEHHPLANGHYLFFGFTPGVHTIELQLPGSVAIARTNKSFQTADVQPGELQLIEIKIGGTLLPETQITPYPKFNFYESIWAGQEQEEEKNE